MTSRRTTNADRAQQRSWLRLALTSSLLDRVPPRYDPGGDHQGPRTVVHARKLLNELMDPDIGTRSPADVLADIRAFREWVEARQRLSRRILLSEGSETSERASVLATGIVLGLTRPTRTDRPPQPTRPEEHPMWDRWMDG